MRPAALLLASLVFGIVLHPASPALSANSVSSLQEMREERVVLQKWDLSCAAAALATVLRYQHGEPVTERQVALGMIGRKEYLENPELLRLRQGFSLLDMKRYAERLGYRGIGLGQMSFTDLLANTPAIVPTQLRGYPHFVVFRGATGREVLLADPAFGNLAMSREKFIAAWTEYPELGRVAFVVRDGEGPAPPGALSPEAADFVMLRPDRGARGQEGEDP